MSLLLLTSVVASSATKAPTYDNLYSEDENSFINMTCKASDLDKEKFRECFFIQNKIRKINTNEVGLSAQIAKLTDDEILKEAKSKIKNDCSKNESTRIKSKGHSFIGKTKQDKEELEHSFCECTSIKGSEVKCLKKLALGISDLLENTCIIETEVTNRLFRKESESKWVSDRKPDFACGLVSQITLEIDENKNWKYTKINFSQAKSEGCNFELNKPFIYKLLYGEKTFKADCKYLDFE
ncbi:MAG: hypothetical protein A2X86_00555 [Bdellovibrionales bacterium GWA2_49_15]|nr:MAG: hypothetical protein A2X86_00555 [Bdellovibrionales bacterium GWA2_49_15]HAZ13244.1 hypothetical protein [Bdellovibrionales bacterium]